MTTVRHSERPAPVDHLGERVQFGKYGFHLTRSQYALPDYKPTHSARLLEELCEILPVLKEGLVEGSFDRYTDERVELLRERALLNYDLNIAYYRSLDRSLFNAELDRVTTQFPRLREVFDLKKWDHVQGVYLMVLDRHKQLYAGQASDVRARVRKHWNGTKKLDRLVYGSEYESPLSIDSFRSLDTVRLFAMKTTRSDLIEQQLVSFIDSQFLTNRIQGGRPNWNTNLEQFLAPNRTLNASPSSTQEV